MKIAFQSRIFVSGMALEARDNQDIQSQIDELTDMTKDSDPLTKEVGFDGLSRLLLSGELKKITRQKGGKSKKKGGKISADKRKSSIKS